MHLSCLNVWLLMVASAVKNGKDRLRKGIGLAALLKSILLNENNFIETPVIIERFHMTSRQPYWCSKTINGGHVDVSNQSCGS